MSAALVRAPFAEERSRGPSDAVLDFHPGGPDGPENGYDRVHGVFRIPLAQFVEDG